MPLFFAASLDSIVLSSAESWLEAICSDVDPPLSPSVFEPTVGFTPVVSSSLVNRWSLTQVLAFSTPSAP